MRPQKNRARGPVCVQIQVEGPALTGSLDRLNVVHQISVTILEPGANADEHLTHPGQRRGIEGVAVSDLVARPSGLIQPRDFAPDGLTRDLLFLISVDEIKHRLFPFNSHDNQPVKAVVEILSASATSRQCG
jgi:hypothetical protein